MSSDTLKILFVHQNYPGQFKALIADLRRVANVELAFITRRQDASEEGVLIANYEDKAREITGGHNYLRELNANVRNAQEVARAAFKLQGKGFVPDVIIGHTGWAGPSFLKDVFPDAKFIGYCEWYFRWENSWNAFAGLEVSMDDRARTRAKNLSSNISLEQMDVGVSPMHWQKASYPEIYHGAIEVIPEGIDTAICWPAEVGALSVPGGAVLDESVKVLTYISRALEPARGFFTAMRAIERLLEKNPALHVVVVGRERAAYSQQTGDGPSYKQQALEKFRGDLSRVHFTGKVDYQTYLRILQRSDVHMHLSSPLFLSWSLLESMAVGCAIVGSDNAPVSEVIVHGKNGKLVSFFDHAALADQVQFLLENPEIAKALGIAARETVLQRYDQTLCVRQWKQLVLQLVNDKYFDPDS